MPDPEKWPLLQSQVLWLQPLQKELQARIQMIFNELAQMQGKDPDAFIGELISNQEGLHFRVTPK